MRKKAWKKNIAILLVIAMMLTIMPMTVFADEEDDGAEVTAVAIAKLYDNGDNELTELSPAEGPQAVIAKLFATEEYATTVYVSWNVGDNNKELSYDSKVGGYVDQQNIVINEEMIETGITATFSTDGRELATASCAVVQAEEPDNEFEAEVPPTMPEPKWEVSRSKTATNLDENFESKVTLSLPSAEEKLVTDVVFVLDESSCSEPVKAEVAKMLSELYTQVKNSDATVKIGAVQFRGEVTKLDLTELTETTKDTVTQFMDKRPETGGSNMSAGLLAGKAMLDADTKVSSDRKYLILVSDGITYIWDDENTETQENYGINFANGDTPNTPMLAGPDGWDVKNEKQFVPTDWNDYLSNVGELLNKTIAEKASLYVRGADISKKPFISYPEKDDYVSTVDIALYKSYLAYQRIASTYPNTYVVMTGVKSDMDTFPFGPSFMTYMANGKSVSFENILNKIIYLVDKGSQVKDYMGYVDGEDGYNFDFVNNATAMTLKVGDEIYNAVKITNNQYGFKLIEGTSYAYKVTYNKSDGKGEEHFIWDINVPVSNFAPVQLTYTVKLTNPKAEAGTYTGLYTNNRATLDPVDSNGGKGESEEFEKPTVSYTVEEAITPTAPDWDKSKSKTATNLDANYQSKVTLSLPSAEEELVSDIVFVLDKSSCNNEVAAQATELLEGLLASIEKTNAKIKVGIVTFRNRGVEKYSLKEISKDDIANIYEIITTQPDGSGTNIDGGLLVAKEMLEKDTEVLDSRKHIVLVTDGLARLFSYDTDNKTGVILHEMSADSAILAGEYTGWCMANGFEDGKYFIPLGDWSLYLSNISKKVEADKDQFVFDFENYLQKSAWIEANNDLFTDLKDSGKIISNTEISQHALAVDRAIYDAYETYVKLENQYNCYAVNVENTPLGTALTGAMNEYSGNSISNSSDMTKAFDSIQKDIYYLLDAGSYVEDYMGYVAGDNGYNFDFINDAAAMVLKVDDTEYKAEKVAENKYSFNDGAYIVEYFPGEKDTEHFVWTMNVPVSNFAPVQLTYTVQLMNPQTKAGTYGVYDENGSKNEAGLYTNNSATLYPVDSNGTEGKPEEFAKPTVSYTVKGTTPDKPTQNDPYDGPYSDDPSSEIPDTDVPTTEPDVPSVVIDEPGVPTTDIPGTPVNPTEIAEPEVPLGDAPKTGDAAPMVAFVGLMAAAVVGLVITRRKFN